MSDQHTAESPAGATRFTEHCHVCEMEVEGAGPWCALYVPGQRLVCRPVLRIMIEEADACGDGPLVDALCKLGRRTFGEDLYW